jgi:hypothetical protein
VTANPVLLWLVAPTNITYRIYRSIWIAIIFSRPPILWRLIIIIILPVNISIIRTCAFILIVLSLIACLGTITTIQNNMILLKIYFVTFSQWEFPRQEYYYPAGLVDQLVAPAPPIVIIECYHFGYHYFTEQNHLLYHLAVCSNLTKEFIRHNYLQLMSYLVVGFSLTINSHYH